MQKVKGEPDLIRDERVKAEGFQWFRRLRRKGRGGGLV